MRRANKRNGHVLRAQIGRHMPHTTRIKYMSGRTGSESSRVRAAGRRWVLGRRGAVYGERHERQSRRRGGAKCREKRTVRLHEGSKMFGGYQAEVRVRRCVRAYARRMARNHVAARLILAARAALARRARARRCRLCRVAISLELALRYLNCPSPSPARSVLRHVAIVARQASAIVSIVPPARVATPREILPPPRLGEGGVGGEVVAVAVGERSIIWERRRGGEAERGEVVRRQVRQAAASERHSSRWSLLSATAMTQPCLATPSLRLITRRRQPRVRLPTQSSFASRRCQRG